MPIYYNSPKITALNQTMIFTHCHSSHPRNAAGANMITLCRSTLLACLTALLAVFGLASGLEARQGFGGFWSGSYYEPPRGINDITPPRANGTTPPRARKKSCAPRVGGSASQLSAVWHSLFQMSPRKPCHRSPVKRPGPSSLNLGSTMSKCSFAQERTLSSVPCAMGSPFRSR